MPRDLSFIAPYEVRRAGDSSVACASCGKLIESGSVYFVVEDSGGAYCAECFGPHVLRCDVLVRDGDLVLTEDIACDTQDALARVFTDSPDWYYYPDLGANLSDLKGLPNTRETASRGEAQIMEALVGDGRFTRGAVGVTSAPVSPYTVVFFISVGGRIIAVPVEV